MKNKFHLSILVIISLVSLIFFSNTSCAQTAVNSVKISGGDFGNGKTLVFPDKGTIMNQVLYTAGNDNASNGRFSIQLSGYDVKYEGKEISLIVLITLSNGKGVGNYTMKNSDNTPPPPSADVSVQIRGGDVGVEGHVFNSENGNLKVTAFGGPGNFVIGTFSGSFYEPVGDKINHYQISGKFKAYRLAND